MEDLGKINIEIKDLATSNSGSGSPGGGPLATRSGGAAMIRINQAVIHINQAVIQQMQRGFQQALNGAVRQANNAAGAAGGAAPPTPQMTRWERLQQMFSRIGSASDIKGELSGFMRSPSTGGITSLLGAGSTTGRAIASLGAAAAPVAIVLGALLAVVLVGVAVFKVMQAAAERVSRKFDEITRFSSTMMYASAAERLAKFQRQIADATRNGDAYANAQWAATQAENAKAQAMLHLDAVAAKLAERFHVLMTLFWRAVKPLAAFVEMLIKIDQILRTQVNQFLQSVPSWVYNIPHPLAWLLKFMQAITTSTAQIAQNTRPTGGRAANGWFIADVQAITGRRY